MTTRKYKRWRENKKQKPPKADKAITDAVPCAADASSCDASGSGFSGGTPLVDAANATPAVVGAAQEPVVGLGDSATEALLKKKKTRSAKKKSKKGIVNTLVGEAAGELQSMAASILMGVLFGAQPMPTRHAATDC